MRCQNLGWTDIRVVMRRLRSEPGAAKVWKLFCRGVKRLRSGNRSAQSRACARRSGFVPDVPPFQAPVTPLAEQTSPKRNWPNPNVPVVDLKSHGVGNAVVFLPRRRSEAGRDRGI